jgi:hypothetical protein
MVRLNDTTYEVFPFGASRVMLLMRLFSPVRYPPYYHYSRFLVFWPFIISMVAEQNYVCADFTYRNRLIR